MRKKKSNIIIAAGSFFEPSSSSFADDDVSKVQYQQEIKQKLNSQEQAFHPPTDRQQMNWLERVLLKHEWKQEKKFFSAFL